MNGLLLPVVSPIILYQHLSAVKYRSHFNRPFKQIIPPIIAMSSTLGVGVPVPKMLRESDQ